MTFLGGEAFLTPLFFTSNILLHLSDIYYSDKQGLRWYCTDAGIMKCKHDLSCADSVPWQVISFNIYVAEIAIELGIYERLRSIELKDFL